MRQFNFDIFIDAKAGIVKAKPPAFDTLRTLMTSDPAERQYIGRIFLDTTTGKTVLLPRKKELYYCACWQYNVSITTCQCVIPCSNILTRNDQIYIVSLWTNRVRGTTRTERWRRECWDKHRPIMEHEWMETKWIRDKTEATLVFDILQQSDEPERKGRITSAEQFNLAPQEAEQRTKLVHRYSTYKHRRTATITALQTSLEAADLVAVNRYQLSLTRIELAMNDIYAAVADLGGCPEGWEYYEHAATT